MINFMIGFMLGGLSGIFLMCLVQINKEKNDG